MRVDYIALTSFLTLILSLTLLWPSVDNRHNVPSSGTPCPFSSERPRRSKINSYKL